ncbi:hypothetical protein Bbelb_221800, partial [Branchiostoma belcheri]
MEWVYVNAMRAGGNGARGIWSRELFSTLPDASPANLDPDIAATPVSAARFPPHRSSVLLTPHRSAQGKKLGWDKFSSLQDALQEVEAKTPDCKGGKKQQFFNSQDDKENTSGNVPPDKARSYSEGFILQHGSRKNDFSKTTPSSNNRHSAKTGLPKPKGSLESPYFSTTGTSKVQATRKTGMPLGDKLCLSNSPSNSSSQKERFMKKSSDSETEDPVPAVKPKVQSVKMTSRAEGKMRVSTGEGKSQGRGSSNQLGGKQKMGSLIFSSGSEADTGSSRDQSGASPVLISSDSDDFESFVQKMKTPTSSRATKPSAVSLDDFIVDSDDDSDDDDDVFGPAPLHLSEPVVIATSSSDEDEFQKGIISRFRSPKPASGLRRPKKAGSSRKASRVLSSSSSDDDDLHRLPSWRDNTPLRTNNTPQRKENTPQKKENTPFRKDNTPLTKQVLQKSFLTPQVPPGYRKPTLSVPKVSSVRTQSTSATGSETTLRRNSEPTCFLSSLSTPARGKAPSSPYVSDFKKHREELVKKLFKLYNETVFDNKLPADMSVTWNNKMRKTAGFCYTGRSKLNRSQLVARIELSDKVCDSAGRAITHTHRQENHSGSNYPPVSTQPAFLTFSSCVQATPGVLVGSQAVTPESDQNQELGKTPSEPYQSSVRLSVIRLGTSKLSTSSANLEKWLPTCLGLKPQISREPFLIQNLMEKQSSLTPGVTSGAVHLQRVRDTLIHEMCHAATWMCHAATWVLNGVKDGHGRYWQF